MTNKEFEIINKEVDNTELGYLPDYVLHHYMNSHNKDLKHARFKIGEKVKVNPDNKEFDSGYGIVLAVSDTGDGMEYLIEGWSILFWEHELEKIK